MANTNETVTVRLIVAADGALRTLDQFDSAMTDAANASVKSGAAIDAMTAHLERMRKAQEAGIPVLKARTAAMSVEERMLNSALGRADSYARARISAERDISRAVASASNLVVQGKMSEEDAIRAVTTVEQAHVAQLNKMIAAQRAAADSAQMNATAVRQSADAVQAYNMSASRNAAESANIAMQFQDIAVSAQMGMSPMMIALQQGTQLSAIFTQMKNPLQALPAAFASIISPVSLLTIGFVALATVGIQWAASLFKGAEDATTALENHQKMLDTLLVGYKDLREAADEAVEAALKLPRGVVQSDLENSLRSQEEAITRIAEKSQSLQQRATAAVGIGRAQGFSTDLLSQLSTLSTLNLTINSTAEQLDAATVAARELYNTTTDPVIREWADEFFQLTNQVRSAQAIIGSSKAALVELNMTDLSGMERWSDVTRDLADWQRDLDAAARAAAAGIQASYQAAILAAQGYGQAAGAANVYAGSLQRLQALIPAVAAAQQAQNQLATAQIEYDKGVKALAEQQAQGMARDVFAERMAELTSTYEQARDAVSGLTAVQQEQDRLTRQNGIDALEGKAAALARVNEQYRQQEEAIRALVTTGASQAEVDQLLAQNAANLETALANAGTSFDSKGGGGGGSKRSSSWDQSFQQRMDSLNQEIALVGQSTYEIERQKTAFDLLNQAKQANVAITPALIEQINSMASSYAAASVELQRMQEIQEFGKQVTSTLADGFKDLFKGLITGTKSANEAIADLLGKLGDLFLDRAFNMLFGGFGMGGGMGGGRGGLLGGFIIPGILHQGGTAGADGYGHGKAYSPAVWANATRYHTGGIAGLQPDEVPAILQRGERVIPRNAANDNSAGGGTIYVVVSSTVDKSGNIVPLIQQVSGQVAGQAVKPVYDAMERASGRYG